MNDVPVTFADAMIKSANNKTMQAALIEIEAEFLDRRKTDEEVMFFAKTGLKTTAQNWTKQAKA